MSADLDRSSSSALPPISPSAQGPLIRRSTSEPSLLGKSDSFSRFSRTVDSETCREIRSSFLKRQLEHPSVTARRGLADRQKALVKERLASENADFLEAKGVAGFSDFLKKRCGSIVVGWRELDIDGNGRLSFNEFCVACR
ncbi:unnamed protein product, partial [Polarella glacialis]